MKKIIAVVLVGLILTLGAVALYNNSEVGTEVCIDSELPY